MVPSPGSSNDVPPIPNRSFRWISVLPFARCYSCQTDSEEIAFSVPLRPTALFCSSEPAALPRVGRRGFVFSYFPFLHFSLSFVWNVFIADCHEIVLSLEIYYIITLFTKSFRLSFRVSSIVATATAWVTTGRAKLAVATSLSFVMSLYNLHPAHAKAKVVYLLFGQRHTHLPRKWRQCYRQRGRWRLVRLQRKPIAQRRHKFFHLTNPSDHLKDPTFQRAFSTSKAGAIAVPRNGAPDLTLFYMFDSFSLSARNFFRYALICGIGDLRRLLVC